LNRSTLRLLFWITDLGFIAYWLATALHLIPLEGAFKDYADPTLLAWNWSFFPLDLLISATGLYALWRSSHGPDWRGWALAFANPCRRAQCQ